jgi:hypothetical protein
MDRWTLGLNPIFGYLKGKLETGPSGLMRVSGLGGPVAVKPTPTERETSRLRRRFDAHIREWWPQHDADFSRKDYNYHIEDPSRSPSPGGDSDTVTLWLLLGQEGGNILR